MSADLSCMQAQFDEIEVLQSIYGEAWKSDEASPGSYGIDISVDGCTASLFVHLSERYPLFAPPTYTISAPSLSTGQKRDISNLLDEEYLCNVGESVLYQWVEKIREYLSNLQNSPDNLTVNREPEHPQVTDNSLPVSIPDVIHGDIISDRKSVFQGHAARVTSVDQVQAVLLSLKSNRKIASATHNIYAYRISLGSSSFAQDCEDDGETQAGSRLLHLLQIVDVTNVMVVVSRWYGGVHLGPDRFRHINNAARQVLQSANFISPKRPS